MYKFVILLSCLTNNIYMNDYKKFLGSKIKELRRSRSYTQDSLSEKIGIDPKHLSRIECGKNAPSLDLIYKICVTLKIKPSALFDDSLHKCKSELIKDILDILEYESESSVRKFYRILINSLN